MTDECLKKNAQMKVIRLLATFRDDGVSNRREMRNGQSPTVSTIIGGGGRRALLHALTSPSSKTVSSIAIEEHGSEEGKTTSVVTIGASTTTWGGGITVIFKFLGFLYRCIISTGVGAGRTVVGLWG